MVGLQDEKGERKKVNKSGERIKVLFLISLFFPGICDDAHPFNLPATQILRSAILKDYYLGGGLLFKSFYSLLSLPCFSQIKMLYDRGCIFFKKKGAGIARKTQQSGFGLAVDYDVMVSQLSCDWLDGSGASAESLRGWLDAGGSDFFRTALHQGWLL